MAACSWCMCAGLWHANKDKVMLIPNDAPSLDCQGFRFQVYDQWSIRSIISPSLLRVQ